MLDSTSHSEKVHVAPALPTVMEQIQKEDRFDEKKRTISDGVEEVPSHDDHDDGAVLDFGTDDPFPMDPNATEEQQFTFRAVFVGCALGAVISASNVYLGLKTGWTFGASMFGSIFGFAILKPLSKALPERFGGGYFGPKENLCCQSAATVR
ncbi:OPT-domain-containing protein [Laetiporus sulphureus 93-53]|uniref:OPT-domain-containing protein n=1 Tax=Laetiporus sulphureus 93-53 TaxID=1314785 RepID=A0A165AZW8_9APHY|nr:OPT-domain-containing protein [Laetiporus sulphureus 93-53]KZS99966.1 OPT-domain-containing protein [Laetiporus sulphureus 93-53]